MSSYLEKLKDPRWQKKRLKVMDAAGFCCTFCGDDSSTLNVHHTFYKKGAAPWEYDEDTLLCLCESCHESQHYQESVLNDLISRIKSNPDHSITFVIGLLTAHTHDGPLDVDIMDDEFAGGFGFYFNKSYEEVNKAAKNGFLSHSIIGDWYKDMEGDGS